MADYERENPIFKEFIKISLTPLISNLSIMDYAEDEASVIGYGITVILMNLGIYFILPIMVIYNIKKLIRFQ